MGGTVQLFGLACAPSKREKGLSGVLVWRSELVKHHSANWGRRKRASVTLCARQLLQHTLLLPLLLCQGRLVSLLAGKAAGRCRHCLTHHGKDRNPCTVIPSPTPPPHTQQLHPGSDDHQTPTRVTPFAPLQYTLSLPLSHPVSMCHEVDKSWCSMTPMHEAVTM